MSDTKRCNNCGEIKPIEEFYLLRADKNWRRSRCKDCHRHRDEINRLIREGKLKTR